MFVWGQAIGGHKWKEFLSEKGNGNYIEIQAGLANTQYECLPMPPKTSWEWMEAYGAMNADGDKVHGGWSDAKSEVEDCLSTMLNAEKLERMLIETKESIALKPGKLISKGSGWGALENLRRSKSGEDSLPVHLDFGDIDVEQEQWRELLENGSFNNKYPLDPPKSWMNQSEWVSMMEKAVEGADKYNWYAWLQIGIAYLSERRFKEAKEVLNNSMTLNESPWALYGLAQVSAVEGDVVNAAVLACKAYKMRPSDRSLAKEAMKKLINAKLYNKAIDLYNEMPKMLIELGRIKLLKAYAHLGKGEIQVAEDILCKHGYLEVPDLRECENSVTDLWLDIQEKRAYMEGKTFNREKARPPKELDFRMFVYDKYSENKVLKEM